MTTATAAGRLQVSERQVERLARAGELVITRNAGRSLLLDSASVHVWVGRNRRQGRPWSAATAWAALALQSRETVDWMAASALSRLRHRLRNSEAADLAWLVRRRATVHRMQGWGDDTGLQRTGVSGECQRVQGPLRRTQRVAMPRKDIGKRSDEPDPRVNE